MRHNNNPKSEKKPGRPKGSTSKNNFDCERIKRLHKYIQSKAIEVLEPRYHEEIDTELAIRLRMVLRKFFGKRTIGIDSGDSRKQKAGSIRPWFNKLKKGINGSIRPENLWALMYCLRDDFWAQIKVEDVLRAKLHTRTMREICTILHYSVHAQFGILATVKKALNPDTKKKQQAIEKKTRSDKKIMPVPPKWNKDAMSELLQRRGPAIYFTYHEMLNGENYKAKKEREFLPAEEKNLWLFPFMQVLSIEDIAIDVKEILHQRLNFHMFDKEAEGLVTRVAKIFDKGINRESYWAALLATFDKKFIGHPRQADVERQIADMFTVYCVNRWTEPGIYESDPDLKPPIT